jgi:hypothetical protein
LFRVRVSDWACMRFRWWRTPLTDLRSVVRGRLPPLRRDRFYLRTTGMVCWIEDDLYPRDPTYETRDAMRTNIRCPLSGLVCAI